MSEVKTQSKNEQKVKLESLFKIKHGFAFKGQFFSDTGEYIVLTPGNFTERDGLILRQNKEKYYTGNFPKEYILNKGDLLIVMTDLKQTAPYLGAPGIVPEDNKFLHNQRLGLIQHVNTQLVCKDFLYWLFEGEEYRGQVRSSASGATVKHTSPSRIYEIEVFIPNLTDQRQIADVLSTYDDLIENNTKRIKILEEIAQTIYREWFVSLVNSNKLPKGWKTLQVESLVKRVGPGKLYDNKTAQKTGDVPILDQGKSGIIGYHNDSPGVEASIENPIIVFANHTCYQRFILFPFSAIQNVLPFYPSEENYRNIFWLHYATKDLIEFNDYKGHWPEFMQKEVVVPPPEIAEMFGNKVKSLMVLAYRLELMNKDLRQARDLLLPKLVTGEIRV